jgi:Flp pilus assembly pilin Flp
MNIQKIKFFMNKQIYLWKNDQRGMGTVEVILIIVVLIGLVIFFKAQITTVIQDVFSKITTKTGAL